MRIPRTIGQKEITMSFEDDLPMEERSVFVIAPISASDFLSLSEDIVGMIDNASKSGYVKISGETVMDVIRKGLRGWRNLKYDDGEEIPYEMDVRTRKISEKCLQELTAEVLIELSNQIMSISKLSATEVKNSVSQLN